MKSENGLKNNIRTPDSITIPLIFSRHETFHPRYLWLKKGFDKASQDSEVFTRDNAITVLGVGKNMVKAIRYWCSAFRVLDEIQQKGKKGKQSVPSRFGRFLLDANGCDPYLEDLASLWLLHWNLIKSPCYATAWYCSFNIFNKNLFTAEDLLSSLQDYINRVFPTHKISESSLIKDVNCLLRMYVEQTNQKIFKEDSIDSPFSELGLISNYGDTKHFIMNIGNKPGLVAEVIVATCLEFALSVEEGAKTISISRLLYEIGSPGLIFKLNESLLCDSIEQVSRQFKDISLSETAGLIQFSYTKDPLILAEDILNSYYGRRRN